MYPSIFIIYMSIPPRPAPVLDLDPGPLTVAMTKLICLAQIPIPPSFFSTSPVSPARNSNVFVLPWQANPRVNLCWREEDGSLYNNT